MRVPLLLAAVLALAACGRDQPPAAPESAGVGTGAASVADIDARNATYPTGHTGSGEMAFRDGRFANGNDEVESALVTTASGDLDQDGTPDVAVILATSTGGSGTFYDLYALRRRDGEPPAIAGPAFLGDRVDVKGLRIEHGEAVVDLVVQGDQDASCCPTVATSWRFRLVGNLLDEVSGQRRVLLHL